MVRTERWRVLLAATLLGVVVHAAPAGAQTSPTSTSSSTSVPESSSTSSSTTTSTAPTTTTTAVPRPVVAGPIAATAGTKGHPLMSALEDLKASGYSEQELFVQGTGTVYGQSGSWGTDGRWAVNAVTQTPYRTRVLVRRPTDPTRFDGTVVVSWLNVNGAFETDPEWTQIGTELMREGAVFVGVSAQMLGVDGPLGAKRWDPARYDSLDVSADSLSYDVVTQVAQAIRAPKSVDLLAGLSSHRRLIASGQSQSAQRLVTYLNAFQPKTHAFDGFLLVSRFRGAAPLGRTLLPAQGVLDPSGDDASHPFLPNPLAALVSGPPQALIRTDTSVPVFVVLTETEARQDAPILQPDSTHFRTWEVAGAADVDSAATAATVAQLRRDFPSIPTDQLTSCAQPNVYPTRYALRAAMRSLSTWVAGGPAPAAAPPIALNPRTGAILRDADGNALGGLRLPEVDVPTAHYSGESTASDYCALTGTTVPLSTATLAQRFPTTQTYADAVAAAADAAVKAGHLLAEDAAEIVSDARGGATEAVIADHAAAVAASGVAAATSTASSTGTSAAARPSALTASGQTITASASAKATPADHGWLATTGRDLITPLLGGLLLILNGRVVLTIAHQRRRRGAAP